MTETFDGVFEGKPVSVFREFGGHRFTDEEVERLLAGKYVKFEALSKKGAEYEAVGHLVTTAKGARFEIDYEGAPGELLVPDSWGGHDFTLKEKITLAGGGTVYATDLVSSRTGRYYSAELEFAGDHGKRKRIRPLMGRR